jgi:hypothetical protein
MNKYAFAVALVLAAVAVSSPAETKTFGDWTVLAADDQSGDVIAATTTETGQELFGYRCFVASGSCVYVLIPNSNCEAEADYPILLNASVGSSLVTGYCFKSAGSKSQMSLKPFKSMETLVKDAVGLLGFAIPMASGAFKAVRFSTNGATAAIQETERRVIAARASTTKPSRSGATTF